MAHKDRFGRFVAFIALAAIALISVSALPSAVSAHYSTTTSAYTTTTAYTTSTTTSVPYCTAGWTGDYRCSGGSKQREFLNSDCSLAWQDYESCTYGCANGQCLSYPSQQYYGQNCYVTVDMDRPSDTCAFDSVRAFVRLADQSSVQGQISLQAYVCNDDNSNCQEMACDGTIDPSVYVAANGQRTLECVKYMDWSDIGTKVVKVVFSGCNGNQIEFSRSFSVQDCGIGRGNNYDGYIGRDGRFDGFYGRCDGRSANQYRCFGSVRELSYMTSDCNLRWSYVEFCDSGCLNGACIGAQGATPTTIPYVPAACGSTTSASCARPLVVLDNSYNYSACDVKAFSFDVINTGTIRSSYGLTYTGDASSWLYMPKSVVVDAGSKSAVTGYVKVPCDASGDHSFSAYAIIPGTAAEFTESKFSISPIAAGASSSGNGPAGVPIFGGSIFNVGTGEQLLELLLVLLLIVALVLVAFYLMNRGYMPRGSFGSRAGVSRDRMPEAACDGCAYAEN